MLILEVDKTWRPLDGKLCCRIHREECMYLGGEANLSLKLPSAGIALPKFIKQCNAQNLKYIISSKELVILFSIFKFKRQLFENISFGLVQCNVWEDME